MTKRLYDDNLYKFDSPQASYWEATAGDISVNAPALLGDESCDVAIIGGGYTGLSAALHLARDHGVDVRVLEAYVRKHLRKWHYAGSWRFCYLRSKLRRHD